MKKILFFLFMSFFLFSCSLSGENEKENSGDTDKSVKNESLEVVSSIVPISSLVNRVGWEYVNVTNIVAPWVSPHGFDVSVKDVQAIENADIIFSLGFEEIDGFLDKLLDGKKGVELSEDIPVISLKEDGEHSDEHHDEHDEKHQDEHGHEENHESEEHHEDEHHHDHNHDYDPHIWLWKDNILLMWQKVQKTLSAILPEHKSYFENNMKQFTQELEGVYAQFQETVKWKTPQSFIVFHNAYNYLYESIGLNKEKSIPFSENVLHETSISHMKELIDSIKDKNIKVAFAEPQFDSSTLQKFSETYSIQISLLDPQGNDISSKGYLDNIRKNLENLGQMYE